MFLFYLEDAGFSQNVGISSCSFSLSRYGQCWPMWLPNDARAQNPFLKCTNMAACITNGFLWF